MFGLLNISRVSKYGLMISFGSEINLFINPEKPASKILGCIKRLNEIISGKIIVVFTSNFLSGSKNEVSAIIEAWAKEGLVLIPADAFVPSNYNELNILVMNYSDELPLSDDLILVFFKEEQNTHNLFEGDSLLITYKSTIIFYKYVTSMRREKAESDWNKSRNVVKVDLGLLCMRSEHIGTEFHNIMIEELPYIIGMEADYLILIDNSLFADKPENRNIIKLKMCEKIVFTRHLTNLFIVKNESIQSSNKLCS